MDGGAWQAAFHGVAKSRTRLSDFPFTFPGTGEPGGLPSMGLHRVGSDLAAAASSEYQF